MVGLSTVYLYVKHTLLPFVVTSTSTTAAWVSVPLAESLSLAEFLLYFHLTPDAVKVERCAYGLLALSTLVPPTDSAEYKNRMCI